MSEDQVKRLEEKLTEGFQSIGVRLSHLETDVGGLKEDVAVLKTDVGGLKADATILKIDMGILKTNVTFLNKFFWILIAIVIASVIKELFSLKLRRCRRAAGKR